jgi:2-isopropylmalate synthase
MTDDVIYDWSGNSVAGAPKLRFPNIHDETLRDGMQSPSVTDPSIERKFEIARLIATMGIYSISIGLPGAGQRAVDDATALAELVRDEKLPLALGAACRTHPNDINQPKDWNAHRSDGISREFADSYGRREVGREQA